MRKATPAKKQAKIKTPKMQFDHSAFEIPIEIPKEEVSLKIDFGMLFTDILNNNARTIAESMGKQLLNVSTMPTSVRRALGESFENAIIHKLGNLDGFLTNELHKYFTDKLADKTESAIKNYLNNNKELEDKIDSMLSAYFKEIKFDEVVKDFFNARKEVFMETFIKSMFNDKKPQ